MLESLYSKFAGFFSKAAVDFMYIVISPTKEHLLKISREWGWGVGVTIFRRKAYFARRGRNFFRKMKIVHMKIFNIYYAFKVPRKHFLDF